ncbi:MAG TPA: hypothetical protein VKB50_11850 [Vicinamibacterales bacterium]|nr:hypothetical protein [Vicinamibacterales bacterium]
MARKTPKTTRSRPQRQKDGAPPVVEDPKLPRMGEGEPKPLRGRAAVMPSEPKKDTGTQNRMAAFKRGAGSGDARMPKEGYPDQEPPKPPRRSKSDAPKKKDGYVRLRVLVHDGELSVVGAKFVEGPLAQTETVHPGRAYEVMLGSRRVATGVVPDAGQWRSFPDPTGRAGLGGHHITELPSYEIAVRIPAEDLSMSALPKAQITLYQWRGAAPTELVAGRSMRSQLPGRTNVIATLKGIRLNQLPKQAQAELRQALG